MVDVRGRSSPATCDGDGDGDVLERVRCESEDQTSSAAAVASCHRKSLATNFGERSYGLRRRLGRRLQENRDQVAVGAILAFSLQEDPCCALSGASCP